MFQTLQFALLPPGVHRIGKRTPGKPCGIGPWTSLPACIVPEQRFDCAVIIGEDKYYNIKAEANRLGPAHSAGGDNLANQVLQCESPLAW